MKYIEIAVSTSHSGSELVADILSELTDEGVAIYDKQDFLNADWDYCDDKLLASLSDDVVVKGFVLPEKENETLEILQSRLKNLDNKEFGKLTVAKKDIDGDEWIFYRKKFFRPVKVDKIVICPEEYSYDKKDGETVVKMDVGVAFGTGEHETTQTCLKLGQTIDMNGKKIADLGCGSGILGISFLLRGATSCFFVDYDSQACMATNKNLSLNGLNHLAVVECGTFDHYSGKYDVIFANLTADIICKFFDDILKFAKKGSKFVFSGILLEKECDVLAACRQNHLTVKKIIRRGEWTSMLCEV